MPVPGPTPPSGQFVIDNFTPGIRQVKSLNHPPGTADDTIGDRLYSTVGCWSSPADGVLRALPRRTDSIKRTAGAVFAGLISEEYRICGLFANDPVASSTTVPGIDQCNTELWIAVEYYDNANRIRKVLRYSRHESTPALEVIATQTVAATFSSTSRPGCCYFVSSRSNSATPANPGVPIVAWSFGGWARFFPNDTAPTVNGTIAIPQDGSGLLPPDQIVGHQNRIVVFPLFQWGHGNNGRAQIHVDNELIYWTQANNPRLLDPALTLYGSVIAYAERDTGYEIQASISNDQLLMIKRAGGGLILQGDLNDLTAIPQPSIKSPGFSLNRGVLSHIGYVYPVNASGVWVVEGGRSSRNLSPYMEPDFWRPRPYGPANPQSNPYLATANGWGIDYTSSAQWGSWVALPSNWLYDTDTEAWWRLDLTPMTDSGNTDLLGCFESHWNTVDWTGRWLWTAPSGYSDQNFSLGNCIMVNEYDRLTSRETYTWLSHPIPVSLDNRIEIDDIAVTFESFDTSTAIDTKAYVNVTVFSDDPSATATATFRPTVSNVNGALQTLRSASKMGVQGTNMRVYISVTAGIHSGSYMAEPPRIHRVVINHHPVVPAARAT